MYLSTPTEASSDATACEVTAKGGDRHEIAIRGRFLPGWLGAFTAGLAQKRLNILSGSARKVHASAWTAAFLVDSRLATEALAGVDFLALAAGRPPAAGSVVVLESFRLETAADGALLVEVRAADQLGFLTALLKQFALFSLFPAEIRIDTNAGRIHDRFWLRGVGGSTPSTETLQALRAELQKLVAGPAAGFADGFLRPALA